ncbi:MAG TPA: hypothetical protein DDX68_13625 [Clostridium sp.]|nr:hypothetical protein [Clostridium sp.]
MTREQAKKNLIALGVAEPTDEQITGYLNQHNGEIKKVQDDADKWKKEAEKAEELQSKLDGIEQQNLSELEKEKKARETAEKNAADLQKQLTHSAVEGIFAKANLSGDEFAGMIGALSGMDLEAAKTSAEAFVSGISKRDEANKTQWQKETFDNTPNPGAGDPPANIDLGKKSAAAEYAKQYSQNKNPQTVATPIAGAQPGTLI